MVIIFETFLRSLTLTRIPLTGENSLGGDNVDDSGGEGSDRSNPLLREQDRFLPIANVARIMKKTIPRTGKVNCHPTAIILHY